MPPLVYAHTLTHTSAMRVVNTLDALHKGTSTDAIDAVDLEGNLPNSADAKACEHARLRLNSAPIS